MFYYNVGYQASILERVPVEGVILRASAQTSGHLEDRNYQLPSNVLFDPQLYWLGLPIEPQEHRMLIAYLSSYPWFGMDAEPRNGAPVTQWSKRLQETADTNWQNRRDPVLDWPTAVAQAVQTELDLGVTKIVLPSPIVGDPQDDLTQYFGLLQGAIEVARGMSGLPLLATVALAERAIYHEEPRTSQLLDALVDGVSTMDGLAGAYIVVAAETMSRERHVGKNVVGSVLWLSGALGSDLGMHVVVNFVESIGIAACAFGATGYGSGYSRKSKRLCVDDYGEGGGFGLPSFHSLDCVLDLRPERDLERLRDLRLLSRFMADRTPASSPLLDVLNAGGSAQDVAEWAETANNLARAREHYVERHSSGTAHTANPGAALAWLQSAEQNWLYLTKRTEEDPLQCDGSHLSAWRAAVEMTMSD